MLGSVVRFMFEYQVLVGTAAGMHVVFVESAEKNAVRYMGFSFYFVSMAWPTSVNSGNLWVARKMLRILWEIL